MCGSPLCAEHTTNLKGIVNLPDLRAAVVEVKHSLSRGTNTPSIISTTRLVKVGESFKDQTIKGAYVQFEVLEIDVSNETVKLREDGKEVVYHISKSPTNLRSTNFGCHLQDLRFEDALNLYSDFKDRIVLVHPKILWSSVSLDSEAQTRAEVAENLEKVFLKQGIKAAADGDKFVWLVPTLFEKGVGVHSRQWDMNSPEYGSIYIDAPLTKLIEQYGQILGRRRMDHESIPKSRVYLRTKMLTKAEVLYAFDTVLAWNGLQVVPVEADTFKVSALPSRRHEEF